MRSLLTIEAARAAIEALPLPRGAGNDLRELGRKAAQQAASLLDRGGAGAYSAAAAQIAARGPGALDEETLLALQTAVDGSGARGYRTSTNFVYNQDHTELVYVPPEAEGAPELSRQLLDWLADAWEVLPAPVLAGICWQEVQLIQPFQSGNGGVARLAAAVVLWRKGYGLGGYAAVETELARDPAAYEMAARSAHTGVYSNPTDFTEWLEYYTAALGAAARQAHAEVSARFEAAHRPVIEGAPPAPVVLRDRQRRALTFMNTQGAIRSGEYQKLVSIVPDTARRDFDEMMDKGLIEVRGVGRGTHYVLTSLGVQEAGRQAEGNAS
ncbi:MAG: Fic family protein [Chloroflexi bacterium]|nr:Fic family protein [Chloroflexota bacterium]